MTGPYKSPPEIDFQGNVAQQWKTFASEYEIYICAAGLDEKPEKRRIMILLNLIGRRGRAIYDTFQYAEGEDKTKIAVVWTSLKNTVIPNKTNC